jgi:RNA polymerase sigma factor (sigma-70 family)
MVPPSSSPTYVLRPEQHLGIAAAAARRFFRRGAFRYTLDELISAAYEGLCSGCIRFDPARGTAPSTYLTSYVEGYILTYHTRERRFAHRHTALDAPIGDDEGGERTLLDRLADPQSTEAVLERGEWADWRALVAEFRDELPARDRDIFERRFLLDPPDTLEEIGTSWSISRQAVQQIEMKLRRKLRLRALERGHGQESSDDDH